MSLTLFSVLCAAATLGGFTVVAGASRLVNARLQSRKWHIKVALLLTYAAAIAFRPSGWVVTDLAVLTGALGGALWVEGGLMTPPSVAVFLTVAGAVDYVSMSGGLSKVIVDRYRTGQSTLLEYLSLDIPVRGHAIPVVGIGDLIVGGAAAAALIRLGLRPVSVLGTMAAGFLTALAYGL
jgi:hypothetical protein